MQNVMVNLVARLMPCGQARTKPSSSLTHGSWEINLSATTNKMQIILTNRTITYDRVVSESII